METDRTPSLLEATIESTEIVGKYAGGLGIVAGVLGAVGDVDPAIISSNFLLAGAGIGTLGAGYIAHDIYNAYDRMKRWDPIDYDKKRNVDTALKVTQAVGLTAFAVGVATTLSTFVDPEAPAALSSVKEGLIVAVSGGVVYTVGTVVREIYGALNHLRRS